MKKISIEMFPRKTKQRDVFEILSDQKWHCRECEGKKVGSGQYAGGGGIQGLQRGTRTRPGLQIEQKSDQCNVCGKITRFDRWTGDVLMAVVPASIPQSVCERAFKLYAYTDAVEGRQRLAHELILDHRFPMQRWGVSEAPIPSNLSAEDILAKFQLLKKDESGNHNLLKSRACENCLETGMRGTPLGIEFWYEGGREWPKHIPATGPEAEQGCVGCGWYDVAKWRAALNKVLAKESP